MSLESVRQFLSEHAPDIAIIELPTSTATVALAAQAHGVEVGQIAKTLAFQLQDGRFILLVASGGARVSNRRFKASFGKGRMLAAEQIEEITGHPVGGVCPFGLARELPVYLDRSLGRYDEVLPAAGAVHSAVRISPTRMAELTRGTWVDVCDA